MKFENTKISLPFYGVFKTSEYHTYPYASKYKCQMKNYILVAVTFIFFRFKLVASWICKTMLNVFLQRFKTIIHPCIYYRSSKLQQYLFELINGVYRINGHKHNIWASMIGHITIICVGKQLVVSQYFRRDFFFLFVTKHNALAMIKFEYSLVRMMGKALKHFRYSKLIYIIIPK